MAGSLRDSGLAVAGGADRLAARVAAAVHAPAEAVGAAAESAGNFVADLIEAGARRLGKPGFALHWLSTVVSAAFQFVVMIWRAVLNIVANFLAGLIRMAVGGLAGLVARDARVFVRGASDIVAGIAGAGVAIFATFLALVQSLLFMQLGERPLTSDERALLDKVYRGSVALDNVRIIDGSAGAFNLLRKFTLGNRIYMKGDFSKGDWAKQCPDVFVHECCHVWQNQHEGTRYVIDALWAQWRYQIAKKNAYDWRAELAAGKTRWEDFNKEAQAEFLRDVYRYGRLGAGAGGVRGEFFDDPAAPGACFAELTDFAQKSVSFVRAAGKRAPA
jgi:hypothetical protein